MDAGIGDGRPRPGELAGEGDWSWCGINCVLGKAGEIQLPVVVFVSASTHARMITQEALLGKATAAILLRLTWGSEW
jgi:hypothetical protein